MQRPANPNVLVQPTPFQRINMAVKQADIIAHYQNPQPHDPEEVITFRSRLRDGREVFVYLGYIQPQGQNKIRLQLIFPSDRFGTELYKMDPHDWSGRRAESTARGEKQIGQPAVDQMADRFDEVLSAAVDMGADFGINKSVG